MTLGGERGWPPLCINSLSTLSPLRDFGILGRVNSVEPLILLMKPCYQVLLPRCNRHFSASDFGFIMILKRFSRLIFFAW